MWVCTQNSNEGVRSPGAKVIGGVSLLRGDGNQSNWGPLGEHQQALLTAELSLDPFPMPFSYAYKILTYHPI